MEYLNIVERNQGGPHNNTEIAEGILNGIIDNCVVDLLMEPRTTYRLIKQNASNTNDVGDANERR